MARRTQFGIDEVGRGPIAGPVAVCAVAIKRELPPDFFTGIHNSKALSEKARERWYQKAIDAKESGHIDFAVAFSNAAYIDVHGISKALRSCVKRALLRLEAAPEKSEVFLDGSLYAPSAFIFQETIIKGDEKIPLISLASIVAKVRRDRRMKRYAKRYPGYGFEKHVGYGTAAHYKAIGKNGLSGLHRRSFLKGIAKGN
jgi:ribonuclease HII